MISKERGRDGSMAITKEVSVDPKGPVTPIMVLRASKDSYKEAELHRLTTDRVKDFRDHKISCNALADEIWEGMGTENSKIFFVQTIVFSTSKVAQKGCYKREVFDAFGDSFSFSDNLRSRLCSRVWRYNYISLSLSLKSSFIASSWSAPFFS